MARAFAICLLLLPSAVPMAVPQMSVQQRAVPIPVEAASLRPAPQPKPAAARTTSKRVVVKVTLTATAAALGTKGVKRHRSPLRPVVTPATTRSPAAPKVHLQPHTQAGAEAFAAALPWPWPPIVRCESLRDESWRPSSSSMARGLFQFLRSTWRSLGLGGDPAEASWRDQYAAAVRLRHRDGLRAWDCARLLGLA